MTRRIFAAPRCDRCGRQVVLGALCAGCKTELGDAIVAALNEGEENER